MSSAKVIANCYRLIKSPILEAYKLYCRNQINFKMAISADALFHFTRSIDNLKGILIDKFKVFYCRESYTLNGNRLEYGFPMVSFCDLPLSLTKEHVVKYGGYGIGMVKNWGLKYLLNPVIYVEESSNLAIDTYKGLMSMGKLKKKMKAYMDGLGITTDDDEEFRTLMADVTGSNRNYLNTFRYIKNYEGDLLRDGKVIHNYRFYDEREWRYTPPIDSDKCKPYLTKVDYDKYRSAHPNKQNIEGLLLDFTASDIKYIIVKSDSELSDLIRCIKSTNGLTKNADEADILATKIFTIDQLNSDF